MSLFNLSSKMFKKLPREVAAHIETMQQHFGKQVNQLEEQNKNSLEHIVALKKQNKELADENAYLKAELDQLKKHLKKDSHNSNRPPSSDSFKKPERKKTESTRKPGGQNGHAGKSFTFSSEVDEVQRHKVDHCKKCGHNLEEEEVIKTARRQVAEVVIKKVVTEHQRECKKCPSCGKINYGKFPEQVKAPFQYGPNSRSLIVYFRNQQYLPHNRLNETFRTVFGLNISPGSFENIVKEFHEKIKPQVTTIREILKRAEVIHADESGIRCNNGLHWAHAACTAGHTCYQMHKKRGLEGIQSSTILTDFNGIVVHDGFKSYYNLTNAKHALCNAHHLRELIAINEQEEEPWAGKLIELLLALLDEVKKERENNPQAKSLPSDRLNAYLKRYDNILEESQAYHIGLPELPRKSNRGRPKQRKGKNLLDRLEEHKQEVLLFATDFRVSFTNNQAERDIRMIKLKQKISGCFRSEEGGQVFCNIRSLLSTLHKQKMPVLENLQRIFCDESFAIPLPSG